MLIHSLEEQHQTIGELPTKDILRHAIKQAKKDPWVFKRLEDDDGEADVPEGLHNVIHLAI